MCGARVPVNPGGPMGDQVWQLSVSSAKTAISAAAHLRRLRRTGQELALGDGQAPRPGKKVARKTETVMRRQTLANSNIPRQEQQHVGLRVNNTSIETQARRHTS